MTTQNSTIRANSDSTKMMRGDGAYAYVVATPDGVAIMCSEGIQDERIQRWANHHCGAMRSRVILPITLAQVKDRFKTDDYSDSGDIVFVDNDMLFNLLAN